MNGIVGGKLVRPAISCRVCVWPATRERLPTAALIVIERTAKTPWTQINIKLVYV